LTSPLNGNGFWQKPIKKTLYLLNVNNYAPEIREITWPLIKHYAKKIGAEIFEITERKFPDWPPVYEKMQIYELAREHHNDWNMYIDSDALIHPDLMDMTLYYQKDTVAHWGHDVAENRWTTDRYFWRDGRHIGSCNWFTMASDWCIELWKPLEDLTREEAIRNIWPIVQELKTVITPEHLIDDYTLSRNIARYGFKFRNFKETFRSLGYTEAAFVWHQYQMPIEQKVIEMRRVLKQWGVD
jgi:hypothetical protein